MDNKSYFDLRFRYSLAEGPLGRAALGDHKASIVGVPNGLPLGKNFHMFYQLRNVGAPPNMKKQTNVLLVKQSLKQLRAYSDYETQNEMTTSNTIIFLKFPQDKNIPPQDFALRCPKSL